MKQHHGAYCLLRYIFGWNLERVWGKWVIDLKSGEKHQEYKTKNSRSKTVHIEFDFDFEEREQGTNQDR